MSLWQRMILAIQLAAALGAELSKLALPGGTAYVPPEPIRVTTQDMALDVRLEVRRVR